MQNGCTVGSRRKYFSLAPKARATTERELVLGARAGTALRRSPRARRRGAAATSSRSAGLRRSNTRRTSSVASLARSRPAGRRTGRRRREAIDVPVLELEHAVEPADGSLRSRPRPRVLPTPPSPSEESLVSSRACSSGGTRRAFSQSRLVTAIRQASSDSGSSSASSGASCVEQLADLVAHEELVRERAESSPACSERSTQPPAGIITS